MLIMEKLMRTLMIALLTVLPISANAGAMIGDVNGDGKVSIADVAALIDYLLRSAENEDMYVYGDVNNDNVVNIGDVSSLIDILLAGQGDEPQAQVITETITANGVTFTMVLVECGTFTMGATAEQLDEALLNEYPAHEVTLTNNYYICQTEVTRELWNAVLGNESSETPGNSQNPVVNVSLFDCATFVDKLSAITGRIFRMPTEAEWEFAARGGKLAAGNRYSGAMNADDVAWYCENSGGLIHPVAHKRPNELGIYDMSGNVAEWCLDWYVHYDSEPQVNPIGPESGQTSVYRGGGCNSASTMCRVSARDGLDPYARANDLGFRVVMNCQ